MKAECVNPFYQALHEVFKLMLDLDVSKGNTQAGPDLAGKEVSVIIKLVGDITGSILFSFPQSTTLEIVKIMSGMEIKDLDSFVTSALAEMSNIISGNAATYLAKANYQCDILPPQITIGDIGTGAKQLGEGPILTIPLQTEIGDLKIYLSLDEKKQ